MIELVRLFTLRAKESVIPIPFVLGLFIEFYFEFYGVELVVTVGAIMSAVYLIVWGMYTVGSFGFTTANRTFHSHSDLSSLEFLEQYAVECDTGNLGNIDVRMPIVNFHVDDRVNITDSQ
jgi:hypothetical protein